MKQRIGTIILMGLAVVVACLVIWPLYEAHIHAQVSQPATAVQQTATHQDACTPVNGNAASGSQATLTIPAPPNGQYVYVGEIDLQMFITATATAALGTFSTTNLNSIQWQAEYSTTANTNALDIAFEYPSGLKAAASGTKVTIVSPTAATGLEANMNACYWYGY